MQKGFGKKEKIDSLSSEQGVRVGGGVGGKGGEELRCGWLDHGA